MEVLLELPDVIDSRGPVLCQNETSDRTTVSLPIALVSGLEKRLRNAGCRIRLSVIHEKMLELEETKNKFNRRWGVDKLIKLRKPRISLWRNPIMKYPLFVLFK